MGLPMPRQLPVRGLQWQNDAVCAPTMRTLNERRTSRRITVDEQDYPRPKAARMNTKMHADATALITPQQTHMPTATTLITTARPSMLAAEPDPDRPATKMPSGTIRLQLRRRQTDRRDSREQQRRIWEQRRPTYSQLPYRHRRRQQPRRRYPKCNRSASSLHGWGSSQRGAEADRSGCSTTISRYTMLGD